MNRQTRNILIALAFSLVFTLIYQLSGPSIAPPPPLPSLPTVGSTPMSQIIVTKTPIAAFTEPIQKKHITEVSFPVELLPASAAVTTSDVLNKIVIEDLYEHDIISLNRVQDPAQKLPRTVVDLADDERAVSVAVDGLTAAGGFVSQGDVVDVVALYPQGSTGPDAKMILQNVKVMAIGSFISSQVAKGADAVIRGGGLAGTRMTLALNTAQVTQLLHVQSRVQIRFLLKNPRDTALVETPGARFDEILEKELPTRYQSRTRVAQKAVSIRQISGRSDQMVSVLVPTEVLDD